MARTPTGQRAKCEHSCANHGPHSSQPEQQKDPEGDDDCAERERRHSEGDRPRPATHVETVNADHEPYAAMHSISTRAPSASPFAPAALRAGFGPGKKVA